MATKQELEQRIAMYEKALQGISEISDTALETELEDESDDE